MSSLYPLWANYNVNEWDGRYIVLVIDGVGLWLIYPFRPVLSEPFIRNKDKVIFYVQIGFSSMRGSSGKVCGDFMINVLFSPKTIASVIIYALSLLCISL